MRGKAMGRMLSGAAFVGLLWTGSAQAQDADTTAPGQAGEQAADAVPDEQLGNMIVVTAQRRSENLQDVPVTVTVFNAEQIAEARIQQIDDVVTRTPGLSFDNFPASQPRLYIRGIGSSDRGAAGDPSSAVFVDDIYMGRPSAIAFDAFDIERIEVLKGPQGTLFGRNVVGGAINVITKKPDIDRVDAAAELTYGNYERLDAAAMINVPFARNTGAVRLSGAYRSHDGYSWNPYLGERIDDQDTLTGRFQIYGEPAYNFRFHFTIDGTRDRFSGPANHTLELDTSDPLHNFYTSNFDPDTTYGSQVGYQDRDTWGIRSELSYDFSFATLTFLGSYRDVDYGNRYDLDGGNPDPASPGYNQIAISGGDDETNELSSQEVRLSSLPDSDFTWVAGFYHYHQETDRSNTFNLDAAAVAPIPLTEIYDQYAKVDSIAVFGDVSLPLTDQLTVFGGVRYSRDDKTARVRNTDSMVPIRGDEFFDVTGDATFDDLTYRAGVEFRPARRHMFYASISRGFKSGGFPDTPANAADAATPFEPETAIQYEIGQKSTFLDGLMIWNNTFYYLDYTNLQTVQIVNGLSVTSNAGKATIKGYETQLDVMPFDGFQLSASYAYTDAKFDEYFEGGQDYSGNTISRAPKHKVTISPSYTYSLLSGIAVTAAVDYRYTSRMFDDNSNQPPEIRDATNFVDARLIIDGIADRFSLSLWGKNLTDERTRTFQGVFLGANFGAFSPPRTYGATLSWEY
ncbi:TonB-dependent receptor [Stakelama tenebrarum]|uniref:TonB-dependent receptor n=1 Tax=Stakelama tenebrarum TaxID=2711215 RepID=A0A6G6Y2D0_9SPHN|nr:TonB-dependent receptor [Sphingosinithalassobacter tenebrarum]QIG78763.1 TonB-dependent receptor [Sphingosinithalassobacter tenebrarum]